MKTTLKHLIFAPQSPMRYRVLTYRVRLSAEVKRLRPHGEKIGWNRCYVLKHWLSHRNRR